MTLPDLPHVNIYTDGSCQGNPGPGGYGVILVRGAKRKELSGGYQKTTNNRMEIMAAIVGLESLKKPCRVTLCSDSQYLVKAIEEGWAKRWKSKGWKRNTGEPALNPDLWARLLDLCEKHQVSFEWVRGHNGHPENERCDELATTAAARPDRLVDEGFERPRP